ELAKYLKNQGLVHQFVNYAEKKGLKRRNLMIQKSYNLFENTLIGSVIYNMLDIESYIEFKNKQDATVKKAISQFE
ncbi:MAG: peptidase S41, partial [Bacteroidaceae bacterium]|nr:peptidase S41 [Bacteroidaceae bacterium]